MLHRGTDFYRMAGTVHGLWICCKYIVSFLKLTCKGERERELYPTIVTTAVIICDRIERLDFLDERELLNQLLEHYTLSCGYNDSNAIGQSHYCIITLYFHLLNRSGHCQIVTIFICTQSLSSVISMCTYCIHKCLLQGLPTASEKKLIK